MSVLVTKQAPDFTAEAIMPDGTFGKVTLSKFLGKYVVLFFYPLDFTFVCPSEIIAFNRKVADFKSKNCEVLGVSVDSAYSHFAWRNLEPGQGGIGKISFPLVSDLNKQISKDYDVLVNESVALRGLFLIDKEGVVQHQIVNNLSLGRSVDEAIRLLDALQFTEQYGDVCPANWRKGDDGMKPTADGVASYLSKH